MCVCMGCGHIRNDEEENKRTRLTTCMLKCKDFCGHFNSNESPLSLADYISLSKSNLHSSSHARTIATFTTPTLFVASRRVPSQCILLD